MLAHASFPNPYDKSQVFLHFDDEEHWVDSDRQDADLETCEVWTTSTYRQADGQLADSTDPTLLLQTITIQQQNGTWFITDVNFLNAPAFCNQ